MKRNQTLRERHSQAVTRALAIVHDIEVERAENAELWDSEGNRYIDFTGGIAVLNTGHRHPKVVQAVQAQLERFTHICYVVAPYEPYVALAEKLNALAPGDFEKKTILINTGAEAVENAVKIARAHTGRPAVIAFSGAFHGRTHMALALTGKVIPYKAGFGPLPAEVYHVPFPNPLHGISAEDALSALDALFRSDVAPDQVAAMIIEPVQGEGGFYVAPGDFLRRLRDICDAHGILLIADEIQTGVGRTGKFLAIEHSGVVPDLITLAKSLGGGLPISAVVGRAEVMDAPGPGGLGSTFGGNPLSCAAALAVLEVIDEEGLLERANALGARLTTRLRAMAERHDAIGDVRALGAMVAFELFEDESRKTPAPDLAKALVGAALQKGLLILSCGNYGNVVRILVPLTAADTLVDEGLDIIETCLDEVAPSAGHVPSAA